LCGYRHKGRQHRLTSGTRSWTVAEDKRAELQQKLDSGEAGEALAPVIETKQQTIAQVIELFIKANQDEGRGPATIRKLRQQLGLFEAFLSDHSKFFPSDITAADVIEFRSSWDSWKSGRTRQKAQTNIRGFIRAVCKGNQADLLNALKTIHLSKEDKKLAEPKPLSEDEIRKLLREIPKTFADEPEKAATLTVLVQFMIATGVSIRDAVQLQRAHIEDGWLRINRQKTEKPVKQRLDVGLHSQLLNVADGNPNYIFWNGKSREHQRPDYGRPTYAES
jgi:integrase